MFIDKNLKVAFFGTSGRSIPILESLHKNFDLQMCVTKSDRITGRKKVILPTKVKEWAGRNSVETIEISAIKNDESEIIIDNLQKNNIHYGMIADFSFIIPKSIIEYFNGNLINIHFSVLPKYRGASPVQFAIKNGEKTTAITFQKLKYELDEGDIIKQYEYTIDPNMTSGELYEYLFNECEILLPKVLHEYSKGLITCRQQEQDQATYTYSISHPKSTQIYKEDAKINWTNSPTEIHNFVRAYNSWPIAWSSLDEMNFLNFKKHIDKKLSAKIYKTEIIDDKLHILEIQVEGKNKTDWKSFENGYLEK